MQFVPLGPLAAFDKLFDEYVLFDEGRSQLCIYHDQQTREDEPLRISIPSKYEASSHYWGRIHCVTRDIILALLKRHETKIYYLISFRMDREKLRAYPLHAVKTNIYSNGYMIESHRAGQQIVFSMNNSQKRANTLPKMYSDRELFKKDVQRSNQAAIPKSLSAPNTPLTLEPPIERIRRSLDDEEVEINNKNSVREGVLLVVRCVETGEISINVVTLGKVRLGIKLRRVGSIRRLKDTFGTKFMTRLHTESDEIMCEPVLCGSQAILICRNDPSMCCLFPTVINPAHGLTASIHSKLSNGLRSPTSTAMDPLRFPISSLPPDSNHLWSNIDVVDGSLVLLTVTPSTGYALFFVLNRSSSNHNPSFFWKNRPISLSIASKSLSSIFLRVKKTGITYNLTVRGLVHDRGATKSVIEQLQLVM